MSKKEPKEKKQRKTAAQQLAKYYKPPKEKGFAYEFKKFISRGNVLDMAIGITVGTAFTAIVTALTNKIIMPLINSAIYFTTGGNGIDLVTVLNNEPRFAADGVTINPKCIYIDWGVLITTVINFFLIAIILFLILRTMNAIKDKNLSFKAKVEDAYFELHPEVEKKVVVKEPTTNDLLMEIRDLLKTQNPPKIEDKKDNK